jgi:aminoglycoside 6'-N-acetyltransferase I
MTASERQLEIFVLEAGDEAVLSNVDGELFDAPVQADLIAQFLDDPRHHIAVARFAGRVVGFASGVHYVHPDKPAELWVNEVGVVPKHQGKGIGRLLLASLFDSARSVGCRQAWVLTDRSNARACKLYRSLGGQEASRRPVMFEFRIDGLQRDAPP